MNVNAPSKNCPAVSQLSKLASGSLGESQADSLLLHVEQCPECQMRIDEIERGALPRIPGQDLRSKGEQAQLDGLIRKAQLEGRSETVNANRSATVRVSGTDFLTGFRRCGLLPSDEVTACLAQIKSDESIDFDDSGSLAQALVKRKKLTPFQARVLLRGRWKGLVLGNYAIMDSLGQGGMGNVFKARHKRLGRIVCLKVINSAGRQSQMVIDRFRNEAKALARLSHPNIVVAHDADESKGLPFLVMEYIEGRDLAKCVKTNGPMPVDQALNVTLQTARALQYAHSQGVIHRDVKPHNLLLAEDPESRRMMIKVLDLGLARFDTMLTDNPDASILTAMTNTGVVVGTVDYMSPEQALDSRTADARSDIYSLGCTLYYLITGKPPFGGDTVMQRLVAHREQTVPSLAESGAAAPPSLDAVLRQMMAKDPDERYQDMGAVARDLEMIMTGGEPPGMAQQQPVDFDDLPEIEVAFPVHKKATPAFRLRSASETRMPILAGVFAILVVTALFTLLNDRVFPRAIKNGGNGRALVVVSSDNFAVEQYDAIVNTLKGENIEVVTASPNYGTGAPDYEAGGAKRKTKNIRLDQFSASRYDALYFVGGEPWDLKKGERFETVKRVVSESVDDGLVISAVGAGWHVVKETKYCNSCETKHGALHIGASKETNAQFVMTHDTDHVRELTIKTVTYLKQRQDEFVKQTPWWQRVY